MFLNIRYSIKKLVCETMFKVFSLEDVLPLFFAELNSQSGDTFIYRKVKDMTMNLGFSRTPIMNYIFTVIVQGPVIANKNLTLNVLFDFLKSQEPSQVVLSTWVGEDTSEIERRLIVYIESGRLSIIKANKPAAPGISNINLQIMSVRNAFDFLKGRSTKYALKVRSDQRYTLSNPCSNLEDFFVRYSKQSQFRRILITSQNTFIYRNFGASDFLQFGEFVDVEDFWNVDLDLRESANLSYPFPRNMKEESRNGVCEIYLTRKYLDRVNYTFEDSLRGSLKAFTDLFILVDPGQIGLVWTKYSFDNSERDYLPENSPFLELTQERWLSLRENGLESFDLPERQEIENR